jgi:hypothetical protein
MKKISVVALMLGLTSPVFAQTVTTTGTAVPNHTDKHTHSIDIPSNEDSFSYGVGADVVVYRSTSSLLDEVRLDGRYNVDTRETTVFAVAKVDLFDYFSNEFGR